MMTHNNVKMNHTDIDWEYLTEILTLMESRQPLFPIEEWANHDDARLYFIRERELEELLGLTVDEPYQAPTEQERLHLESGYSRLHTHTHFLLDLEFIDQHDRSEWARNHPGGLSPWLEGYEVWPVRITAKGYFFLETVRESDQSKTGVLQALQKATSVVATEAIKHGLAETLKMIGRAGV